jgi:methyl-accepting chemotaxis protein
MMNLRTKILLSSGLPLLVVLVTVAAFLLYDLYVARVSAAEDELRSAANEAALRIDGVNRHSADIASLMATAQAHGMFGDRGRSIEFARGVLENTPDITGAYFGYEPGADGDRPDNSRVDPRALGAEGRFLPYWFRGIDNPDEIALTPLVDMETSYYYRGVENLVRKDPEGMGITLPGGVSELYREETAADADGPVSMITEPYIYEGKFIVEQTAPIIIDGRFVGIAGVDRALNDIDGFLRGLRTFETAEFLLISKRGRIIGATMNADLRAQRIEESPYANQLRYLYLGEDVDNFFGAEDPVTGEARFFVGATIPTGDWRLLLTVTRDEVMAPVIASSLRVLVIVVIGIGLAMAIAFVFLNKISERIERAASAAARVAAGDLTQTVNSSGTDESGRMLRSLGDMVTALHGLIGKVKGSSVQLVSAATDIAAAAQKQKEITNDFGASTSEIAASTNEITATSRELLQTMTEISTSTGSTAAVATQGRANLAHMESTMQMLANATNSISAKLAVISERANNIGTVVTTITKVADQTNLLSLNAAIEAEKAGEYGLGFSVVAREIRRLADQTAIATLDIERIVVDMQSAVSSGVMEMDRFDEQVRQGVGEATRLSGQLGDIIENVENLRPQFEFAQQSMQAQVVGAGQINDAMLQLREVALVSGESSESLHAASGQLLDAVESLKVAVARFRTSER